MLPRLGDTVLHKPTGENWVVAYADPETNTLAWIGWPDGRAFLSDCELVKRCSDEFHDGLVEVYRRKPADGDSRRGNVLRLYDKAVQWP